jgi:D-3-phosphoglycerate dehydrogenase
LCVKILVCDNINPIGVQKLKQAGFNVDIKPFISNKTLANIIRHYHVIIIRSRIKISKELICFGKNLKIIGRVGSGLDNINLVEVRKKNIIVFNTPEATADAVAELTICMILVLVRKVYVAVNSMKNGKWLKKEIIGSLLKGKTLGLIGMGNIGIRVSKIAHAFDMKILIYKRKRPSFDLLEKMDAQYVPLKELLERSEIISIHVPLTKETGKMISSNEIDLMKEGVILVNTSRGGIIDEKSLFQL